MQPATSACPAPALDHGRSLTAGEAALFRRDQRRSKISLGLLTILIPAMSLLLLYAATVPTSFHARVMVGSQDVDVAYLAGVRDGPYLRYYDSGELREVGQYERGLRVGLFQGFYKDGQRMFAGTYRGGVRDGAWAYFDRSGAMAYEEIYDLALVSDRRQHD